MMNSNIVKGIGIGATVIGLGVELVSDWVNDKKLDELVEEKVNQAFAEREQQIEEEP